MPYRGLIEALYTLNSSPVVSFNGGLTQLGGSWRLARKASSAEAMALAIA